MGASSVSGNRGKENQFWNRGRREQMGANLTPNSGYRKRKESWTNEERMPSSQSLMNT